ncbi:M99 family carboxypeptidase catalytic domain-containing protein [Campylobacter californiensis]|uniref:M99 family carboxypeptidase catalytic domain-containing protein n=1 Tax=Campylobacter californiensis TaxID=1032243 RepID=UPI001D140A7F|nr:MULTISPECIES: M99 family carboxypeptidase catalytic domain-containing protein [unclassified Campylobacter]
MKFLIKILPFFAVLAFGSNLEYALIKKGIQDDNTMLVIGGIQGDEPGGFLAASIVATDYNITKGSLWVVPNLNFPSIIQRNRGTKGDMNRKFGHIDQDDPDFKAVTNIKKVIADQNVSLVLNLHDGSGFYRPNYINEDENPRKWGNTCIIDQERLEGAKYPDLNAIATRVKDKINENILNQKHTYFIKNTQTAKGDLEMLKSLTYYAVTQDKSAFANEASKNLNAEQRTYYHLLAIEEYMRVVGIEFTRPFKLTVQDVKKAIEKEIRLSFYDDAFVLNIHNLKGALNFVPLKKGEINYSSSNPLIAVIKEQNGYKVQYGNRFVTRLNPQYFEHVEPLKDISLIVDGKNLNAKSGDKISVKNSFNIAKQSEIRTNVIGYNSKNIDEAGENITKNRMLKSFSIDKEGNVYRVEFYKKQEGKDKFAGMILVEFR